MSRNLAILLFDDVEVLDFCGPFEVFSVANNQCGDSAFTVYTVAQKTPVIANNGLSVNADYSIDDCPKPDILLVPGGIGTRAEINNELLLKWIEQVVAEAELVLSVCTGALILGKIGLLDGLEATTHHVAYDLLREMVPTGTIHEDRRFVDNGSIVTSAGIAAGIDMSLHAVERLLGRTVAEATSRRMEYPWASDIDEFATSDNELLSAFENCTLPFDQWTHRAHVRVAYLYASTHDLESAISRIRESITAYNKATGTPDAIDRGFHETITQAFMRLVFTANAQSGPHQSSCEFCESHPELMTKDVLRDYYSRDVIRSWEAKRGFVEPDLSPLPVFANETDASGPQLESLKVVETLSETHVGQLHQLIQQQWWGGQRSLDDVRAMVENSSLMIGIIDQPSNRLVGYGRVLTDFVFRATIYDVMVDRAWQGQGLGKHLLDVLSSHPKLQQVSKIYLACEPALFSFYEKWGFQEYEGRSHWMIKVQREE